MSNSKKILEKGTLILILLWVSNSIVFYAQSQTISNLNTRYTKVEKIVSQSGNGDYRTIQEAFDDVPNDLKDKWIIHLKPGIYKERPILAKGKVNVVLKGENALTTIITNNISAGDIDPITGEAYGTKNTQTLAILADDFEATSITIANSFINYRESGKTGKQAVALKTSGDRQAFYHCRILGYQDTFYGYEKGRAYFKHCYIEGNVDFIFGKQTAVFDQCTLAINRNGSVIVAPATEEETKFGFVFFDCKVIAPNIGGLDFDNNIIQTMYFGRPWKTRPKAAFIRTEIPSILAGIGWSTMNKNLNPLFLEYESNGDGAMEELLKLRGNEGRLMTDTEVEHLTIENIMSRHTDPSFQEDWIPNNYFKY